MIDALTRAPASETGRAWHDVTRHAVLAHHCWTTGLSEVIDEPSRWAGLADVTAIAQTLARLDPGQQSQALGVAAGFAHLVAVNASAEAVNDARRSGSPAGPRRVVPLDERPHVVRSVQDIPAAFAQTTRLINGGTLAPARVAQIGLLQAKACIALADGIDGHGLPGRSRARRTTA